MISVVDFIEIRSDTKSWLLLLLDLVVPRRVQGVAWFLPAKQKPASSHGKKNAANN